MRTAAVIMAGGRGERFWPKSRTDLPKQFLSLTSDGRTMIQKTAARLKGIAADEDIFVVTNSLYGKLVSEQLPFIPNENILLEPCGRNTAPCIALAAAVIEKKYGGEALMIVLPSDHLIKCEDIYRDTLRKALTAAEAGENLVTIGITPTYPETGYGYINFSRENISGCGWMHKVKRFVEKPDMETAKSYLASGEYLWNSGMFVWKTGTILSAMKKFMPDIYDGAERIAESFGTDSFESVLACEYEKMRSESVDFGIMEKAEGILTVPGSFGWDDVGNWLAVERINSTDEKGNFTEGDVVMTNTRNCTICGGKRLIAAAGLENIIIVDTDDAVLVCDKAHTQDVKKIIEELKSKDRKELL